MGLTNVLTLSQIAGHIVGLVLSVCVMIPMLLHHFKFSGTCMLFAEGVWGDEDGLFRITYTNQTFCDIPIVTSVFVFFICSAQIYRYSRLYYKKEETTFLGLFLDVVASTFMVFFTIISAFFITLGFIVWCSDMTQRFPSCDRAAGQNITTEELHIDTSGFYLEMGAAQFGIWGAFAASMVVSVVAYLKLINDHQLYNMKINMYLERQRLVCGDSNRDSLNSASNSPVMNSPTSSTNQLPTVDADQDVQPNNC